MATRKSKLLEVLDYHWNQYWSNDKRIKLIICGSSASWIIEKIVKNRGGLHNRVTHRLRLEPFNLRSTKQFLIVKGLDVSNRHILQLYMVTGGVPYYLSEFKKPYLLLKILSRLLSKKTDFF